MINKAINNVYQTCFNLQPTESVLIVTDPSRSVLAGKFIDVVKKLTPKTELVSFDSMTENAQEPPENIALKMAKVDAVLLITTYSLSHTKARKTACKNGARIASMPGITEDIVIRTLSGDYSTIAKTSQAIAKSLQTTQKISITSPKGTNLNLAFSSKRPAIADTGLITKPGDFGNLPAGEAFIAPLEEKTNGVIVFDGAFANIDLDKPIKVVVKNGIDTSITGGKAAKILKSLLKKVGPKAKVVAELGIGTNPYCQLSPNTLEAEKVYGTCHLALGNNIGFGGKNNVPFHSDGIILNPTIAVDGKIIVSNNQILI